MSELESQLQSVKHPGVKKDPLVSSLESPRTGTHPHNGPETGLEQSLDDTECIVLKTTDKYLIGNQIKQRKSIRARRLSCSIVSMMLFSKRLN